jgi:hypothetical protein
MLRGLAASEVRFVVIGGLAAAAHGSAHVTNDLDLCYDAAEDNVGRLAALLASWKAYPRGVEPGLPFFMDVRTFRTTPVMTLRTSEGDLDVLDRVTGLGAFADLVPMSQEVTALDTSFLALGLPALIRSKRATGRRKDLMQLPELEALLALRERKGKP